MRRILTPMAALQIGSLACLPVIVAGLAVLYRHETRNTFVPVWDYIFSIQFTFPPILLFVFGYILAFLTGNHLSDVPRVVVGFFRNRYLQSPTAMAAGMALTAAFCTGALWYSSKTPAPEYQKLVQSILRGESDSFADAKRAIAAVEEVNAELAIRYRLVLHTFEERARINLLTGQASTTRARLLVRSLSGETNWYWSEHPLRWHALAEAYSLLAGAMRQSEAASMDEAVFGELSSESLSSRSIELYRAVSLSTDSRTIPLMRASAFNNLGNTYLYRNEVNKALEAWREANSEELGFRNTGTWGNIVAGLVILGRYDDAIEEGEAARSWAESNGKALQETSQFVSIVVNTAFARLAQGDFDDALADFRFADAIQEDKNTRLNLALSYALLGYHDRAREVLRSVEPPVTAATEAEVATSAESVRCAQLIWFLADPEADAPTKAARLHAFRGRAFSKPELLRVTEHKLGELRSEIADWLPRFPGSCATFAHIDLVVSSIRGF